ncbi:MAG TPA: SPOR domain-containing protein [Noviherbaspirillum sp.]|jgi:DedD protein|uniref:SPOR domain-containing protein n=1 Tax=Noviherbaspirillum sp. TaxID=1926288 RepID=UPI002F91EDF3
MSLFSFFRKNKQESDTDDSTFYSRAEEDSKAARSRRSGGRSRGKEEAADPVLPEKKRARRRLIGAVALVLAAVIGLPMILDTEPRPLGDDIVIQIPSKDKPATPAAPAPAAPVAGDGKSPDVSAGLDEREEVMEPASAPPKAAPTASARPEAAAGRPEPKKESEKPAAAPAVAKAERKPEPKPAEASQEDARAKALLEGKPDPKAEKKDSTKYVIQVAALATKDKVNELQAKLKTAGIKSYTQTVATASGERTRIRVGPFPSKDEAEKVRARIVNIGLNGTLVPA